VQRRVRVASTRLPRNGRLRRHRKRTRHRQAENLGHGPPLPGAFSREEFLLVNVDCDRWSAQLAVWVVMGFYWRLLQGTVDHMSNGPWKFHASLDGYAHVVADSAGRILAGNVPPEDGRLMAAAPMLLEFVAAIGKRNDLLGAQARTELKILGLEEVVSGAPTVRADQV
jgi:hypothetical protein